MKRISEVFSISLFDISPSVSSFTPDHIMAAAGFATVNPQNVEEILKNISEEDVRKLHRESTRRGHASVASLPSLDITFEGSRILDYFFTAIRFTRSIIVSSRRTKWSKDDILIPDEIWGSPFKSDYENILYEQFEFYSKANERKIPLEQSRKVLGFGFSSHGLIKISIDSATEIVKMKRNPYLPNEIALAGRFLEEILKEKSPIIYENKSKLKIGTLYPFPNLFINPKYSPDYSEYLEEPKILSYSLHESFWKMKEKIDKLRNENEEYFTNLSDVSKGKMAICYTKPMSVAVFNEEKRHGSIDMEVESIYLAIDRCLREIESRENVKSIYIPNQFKKEKMDEEYLKIVKESLETYREMVRNGIKPGEAVYVVPQGIKVVVSGVLNGYHLFHPFGYFGVRMCSTAEEEMRELTENLAKKIKEVEPRIGNLIGPKCKVGYCPERKFCGKILDYNPSYTKELHKSLQSE